MDFLSSFCLFIIFICLVFLVFILTRKPACDNRRRAITKAIARNTTNKTVAIPAIAPTDKTKLELLEVGKSGALEISKSKVAIFVTFIEPKDCPLTYISTPVNFETG